MGSHVITLMANLSSRNSFQLRAFTPCSHSHFSFFLSFYFFFTCFVMFLFCFVFIFRADTSLFLFNLIFERLILLLFLIIIIIIRCSGTFRDVPCSWFYDGRQVTPIGNSSTDDERDDDEE